MSTQFANYLLVLGLSREKSARYIGVSPNKFDELVRIGAMPKPRRIHRRKLWDRRELDDAFECLPRDGDVSENNPWLEEGEE